MAEANAASPPAPGAEHKRTEGARLTQSKGKEIASGGRIGGPFTPTENPEFIERRLAYYLEVKAKRDQELAEQPRVPITITLPDGAQKEGVSWETSPMDIALGISQGLADNVVVAKVFYTERVGKTMELADSSGFDDAGLEEDEVVINKGELWDLTRPLEGSCKLELLKFDEQEAKAVFWHSSAHILGECMECKVGSHLTVGPPVDPGFYYDAYIGDTAIDTDMKSALAKQAVKVTKQKQKFERIVLTKEEALEMFKENPFKVEIIKNKIKDGSLTTAYRCGPLIDLCMGPHVVHTGKVKAFEITKTSAAYWLGDASNDTLQRVYGISFPDKKQMKEYKEFMKKAEENDHRKRGTEQDLFFFHPLSPGSCFFLQHGTRIYNTLMDFIKNEYRKRGYDEVISPNVYNVDLWKQSGHWEHYQENMFSFTDGEASGENKEPTTYALKPMNCPGHCLMFGHSVKSWRDLPVRMADFGVLHRNEISGSLTGLTRVRRFQQDDAHIFCRKDQIKQEVLGALDFMQHVYGIFGMTYKLERSTRPKKAIGLETPEGKHMWDYAEDQLAEALDEFAGKGNWRDNPGDGAFYGPKIDIKVFDAMKRRHQCATVQLDFQLPLRFDLKYSSGDKSAEGDRERPVIVHRAMLGSVERMIGVLTEHYGGKWPFWLSPRQIMLIPVHQSMNDQLDGLKNRFHLAGFYTDVDTSNKTLPKKVLLAQKAQYNFILVVGKEELDNDTANIRTQRLGQLPINKIMEYFTALRDEKIPNEKIKDAFEPFQEFVVGAARVAEAPPAEPKAE